MRHLLLFDQAAALLAPQGGDPQVPLRCDGHAVALRYPSIACKTAASTSRGTGLLHFPSTYATIVCAKPEWRNGRRRGLKNLRGNSCEFDSHFGHHRYEKGRPSAALSAFCGTRAERRATGVPSRQAPWSGASRTHRARDRRRLPRPLGYRTDPNERRRTRA